MGGVGLNVVRTVTSMEAVETQWVASTLTNPKQDHEDHVAIVPSCIPSLLSASTPPHTASPPARVVGAHTRPPTPAVVSSPKEHGTNALFATPLCIGNRPSVPRWRAGQP